MRLNGKNGTKSFIGKKPAANGQINFRFMFLKTNLTPGGCLPLPRGYIHVLDHYPQTSSLKSQTQMFTWSLLGKGGVYINGPGHMTIRVSSSTKYI